MLNFKFVNSIVSVILALYTLFIIGYGFTIDSDEQFNYKLVSTFTIILGSIAALVFIINAKLLFFARKFMVIINDKSKKKVNIIFGNILEANGDLVLPTNTFFNTDPKVINGSLLNHYICQSKNKGDHRRIDESIDLSLAMRNTPVLVEDKAFPGSKLVRYKPGSIVKYYDKLENKNIYFVAITDVYDQFLPNGEIDTFYVKSEKSYIDIALKEVWFHCSQDYHNWILNIPLIGTGRNKAFNDHVEALDYIVESYKNYEDKRILDELNIYVDAESITPEIKNEIVAHIVGYGKRSKKHIVLSKFYFKIKNHKKTD